MNVSPLDLRQQRFRKTFRGYDPVEAGSFLLAVADDYEQALRETDRLTLKRKDVETSIEANIMTLRNTLDFVREQEARERDDKVLLHRPRAQHIEPIANADAQARKVAG